MGGPDTLFWALSIPREKEVSPNSAIGTSQNPFPRNIANTSQKVDIMIRK